MQNGGSETRLATGASSEEGECLRGTKARASDRGRRKGQAARTWTANLSAEERCSEKEGSEKTERQTRWTSRVRPSREMDVAGRRVRASPRGRP